MTVDHPTYLKDSAKKFKIEIASRQTKTNYRKRDNSKTMYRLISNLELLFTMIYQEMQI